MVRSVKATRLKSGYVELATGFKWRQRYLPSHRCSHLLQLNSCSLLFTYSINNDTLWCHGLDLHKLIYIVGLQYMVVLLAVSYEH